LFIRLFLKERFPLIPYMGNSTTRLLARMMVIRYSQ